MASGDCSPKKGKEFDPDPLRIDWLNLSTFGCRQNLGICALPGCRYKDNWRNLSRDIESLSSENVQDIFVLCTTAELHKYRVTKLLTSLSAADMTVHHRPILDGMVPPWDDLMSLVTEVKDVLMSGRKTIVHCYGGLGRSCLVGVCLLMTLDSSLAPESAMETMRQLRQQGSLFSVKQYNFLTDFKPAISNSTVYNNVGPTLLTS